MKHYSLNRFNSLNQIVEYDPSKEISQIVVADKKRKPLKDFTHSWYRRKEDLVELAKINLGSFHTPDIKSILYGWAFWDSGHQLGTFSDFYTECWLDKKNVFHIDNLKSEPKVPKSWGISLFYPLVLDGKPTNQQWNVGNNASRAAESTARTLIGQKEDGAMVLVRAEKLTGKQSQSLMLELGCKQAINADGGHSSQMQIGDKHYGSNRPLGTVLVVMGKPEPKEVDEVSVNHIKISDNFSLHEFECKDGNNQVKLHPELLQRLQTLRTNLNKAIIINSGYRTPEYNKKVGGVPDSFHIQGMAADIVVKGLTPKQVATEARKAGFRGIISYATFTHVDVRQTPYYRY
jgi:hypothetical protein